MKKLFVTVILFVSIAIQAQKTTRIACIGNSITYGMGVENREKNSYPAQLQAMLGKEYQVLNFGVSGCTLLKNGDRPYWDTKQYKNALASQPDIVFIKLGTNDSKSTNRAYYDEFEGDYNDLILSFKSLPSNPRIILLLPVPSFLTDSNAIFDPIIKAEIIPRVQKVAFDTKTEVINLHPLFINKPQLLPDKVHPSSLGATIMARRLYEAVKINEIADFDIFEKIKTEKSIESFYGFECANFTFENRACKIVKPKKANKILAWVWRTNIWEKEPQIDIALLERGYHIVYCDMAELHSSRKAMKIWNNYYDYLQTLGLAKKAALETMGNGVISSYNWAMAYPNKLACIYANHPEWNSKKARKIAKLEIPSIYIVSDSTSEEKPSFEQKLKNAGADITIIRTTKENQQLQSLKNPSTVVDFILRATNNKTNFACIAAPGSEYRPGAGWKINKDWWRQHENIDSLLLANKNLDILFVGNSITQGIMGNRTGISHSPGFEHFSSTFEGYSWECAGVSSDRTENILWRLQNGSFKTAKPKIMVLTLGVNNFPDDSAEEIVEGIHLILQWIENNMPDTKILLVGPLPAGTSKESMFRIKHEQVHALLQKSLANNVIYAPINEVMLDSENRLNPKYYAADAVHLRSEGYRIWAEALKKEIETNITK